MGLRLGHHYLSQHRAERHLRRRRDHERRAIGDRQGFVPGRSGRHDEPLPGVVRIRRPLRFPECHGAEQRRPDRPVELHRDGRHGRPDRRPPSATRTATTPTADHDLDRERNRCALGRPTPRLGSPRAAHLSAHDRLVRAGFSGGWSTVTSPAPSRRGPAPSTATASPTTSATRRPTPPRTSSRSTRPRPDAPAISLSESSPYAFVSGRRSSSTRPRAEATTSTRRARMPSRGSRRSASPDRWTTPRARTGRATASALSPARRPSPRIRTRGLTASDTFTVASDTTAPSTTDNTGSLGSALADRPGHRHALPERRGRGRCGDLLHDRRLDPDDELLAGHERRPHERRGLHGQVLLRRPSRQCRARPHGRHADPRRPDEPVHPGAHVQRVEPVRARDRHDDLCQERPGRNVHRRRDVERPALGHRQDALPGGVDDSVSPYQTIYALDDLTGSQTVTAFDNAGNTASSTFDVAADDAAPTGGSVTLCGRLRRRRSDHGLERERHRRALRRRRLDGCPRAADLGAHRRHLRRLRRRLEHRHEPRHGRDRYLRPVPLPRLRPGRQRGHLHLRERRQGRPDRAEHHDRLDAERPDERHGRELHVQLDRGRLDLRVRARRRPASAPARARRATPASPTAATPSRCAPPTRPATPTPRRPQFTWTVDTAAPNTTIGSPERPDERTGASFTFSSTEAGSTFECELDGAGFCSCTSPKSYAGLADGSHTFKVRATDPAGNTDGSPAQFTWTVDTAAPNTTIDASPPDPDSSPSPYLPVLGERGRLDLPVRARRRRFCSCSSPNELRLARRR